MNYIQLSITANEAQQEELIGFLSAIGATGFEQTDTQLLVYFDEANFPSYEVNEIVKDYAVETTNIKEQNWNAVWESNFQPVVVGDFCAVRAHFHQPITGVQHEILITPKMSFGTGHHATTHMMMEQMQGIDFKNKTVFDFGTGTGILAILAEKLGAARVLAIDNDEWSYENAQENIAHNNCNKIDVQLSSVLPTDQTFDIVLANINKNVILQYLNFLKTLCREDGLILFSGLLVEDKEEIVATCQKINLLLTTEKEKSNWISLLFVNRL